MADLENKQERIEALKSEVLKNKKYILSMGTKLPLADQILQILIEMDGHLESGVAVKAQLEKYSFGIFRLTTDNYTLEKSPLGQSLLSLQKNTRRLIQDYYS